MDSKPDKDPDNAINFEALLELFTDEMLAELQPEGLNTPEETFTRMLLYFPGVSTYVGKTDDLKRFLLIYSKDGFGYLWAPSIEG